MDAIRGLLDPGARWGAPEGPADADCRSRDQVIAWWAGARAAGARAVVTEATAGDGGATAGKASPDADTLTLPTSPNVTKGRSRTA